MVKPRGAPGPSKGCMEQGGVRKGVLRESTLLEL